MPPPPKPNKETQVADSKLQKKVPSGEDRLNLVRLFSGQYERIVQVAKNSLKWGSHSDEPSIGLSNFLKGLIRNTMIVMKEEGGMAKAKVAKGLHFLQVNLAIVWTEKSTVPLFCHKGQKEKKNENDEEEWRMRLIMRIKATWTFWRVGRPQHEMGHNMIERSM
ncbi:hypothetical protein RUM44_008858 [Polyplax serrata]|uniref:Uncharacterized protein n=1 Tax=Polyplax serrata TaxID=468196 RepID=A0ABR1BDK8_POLSC